MLFYTDKKNKIILNKEAYLVIPSFKKLTDSEMMYVILSTDYYSIYHQYPEKDRKRKARRWVYGKNSTDPEKDPRIRQAIKDYQSIQYDEKRHTLDIYRNKRRNFEIRFENEEDPEKANKLMKAISDIQKMIDVVHQEITTSMQSKEILQGDRKMSLVEEMRLNKELFDIRDAANAEIRDTIIIENQLPESRENVAL